MQQWYQVNGRGEKGMLLILNVLKFKSKRPVTTSVHPVERPRSSPQDSCAGGDGGQFSGDESRRAQAAAPQYCREAQDCRAGDVARSISGGRSTATWSERQHGALLAEPLSPGPAGREERRQHPSVAGECERVRSRSFCAN